MLRLSIAICLVLVLAAPVFALDQETRDLLASWEQERDRAAFELVRSWLGGDSDDQLRSKAAKIVTAEARILVVCPSSEVPRRSLLWGLRVTPQNLPAALLERLYGLRLDPGDALVNRPFPRQPKQEGNTP